MTEQPSAVVPAWTLGDRLRKARDHAGWKQAELADVIGISRASVVNYETGRHTPSRPVLLSWALSCGVDYGWLSGGDRRPLVYVGAGQRAAGGYSLDTCFTPLPASQTLTELAA